jgi:hypothetical protein
MKTLCHNEMTESYRCKNYEEIFELNLWLGL